MTIVLPEIVYYDIPGLPGPAGAVAPIDTDVTMAADSDVLVASQKATKARIEARTLISGFSAAAAVADADTLGVNQGAGNLKQTFAAIKTWITNWLASAALTWSNKTLTMPTINGATLSGSLSGSPTFTGFPVISSGSATSGSAFLQLRPNDFATGKPSLFFTKSTTASQWNIDLYDGATNGGTIAVSAGSFTWAGSPVMTRGASEVITGLKYIRVGNGTTLQSFLMLEPTDFGVGKPRVEFLKSATASEWIFGLWDGASNAGSFRFNADSVTLNGSPFMTRGATEVLNGIKTVAIATATTFQQYAGWRPTDHGPGKPGVFLDKAAAATQWNLALHDTVDNTGILNFQVTNLTHNDLPVATTNYTGYLSDADITLASNERTVLHIGTLTANRAITLPSGVPAGTRIRITRTGAGAFSLNIGTGPLKALATNTWCEVTFNGSGWLLSAYGAL